MPQYNTGTSWDQGLNALGTMLFRDPSSVAQAGYYGSQQRKTQVETMALERKADALANLPGWHGWGQGPAPTNMTPGPNIQDTVVPKGPWPAGIGAPPGGQAAPVAPPVVPPTPTYVPGQATQLAGAITQGPNALNSGTPAPVSSPAAGAGAPAAPNTTGSDGSIPTNDPVSGPIHPGTLTSPDGGAKTTGPAQANGSPAPVIDLNALMVRAVQAGLEGEQLASYMASNIVELEQAHMLDHSTAAHALAAFGRTGQLQTDTTIAQQAMASGTASSNNAAIVAEDARQFNKQPRQVVRPDNTLGGVSQERWEADQDKYRFVDPSTAGIVAGQTMTPRAVYGTKPDGSVDTHKTELVSGAEAMRTHRQPAPNDFNVTGTDTARAEEGGKLRDKALDKASREMYPIQPGEGMLDFPRKEPALLTPEAKAAVNEVALEEFNKDEKLRADQKNFGEAQKRAMKRLQDGGYLPTPEEVKKQRHRDYRDVGINIGDSKFKRPLFGNDPALVGEAPNAKFTIKLLKPYPSKAGAKPKDGKLGSVITQVGPQQPPGPAGPSPQATLPVPQAQGPQAGAPTAGVKPGTFGIGANGKPLIMRNGVWSQPTLSEQQYYDANKKPGPQAGAPG